MSPNIIRQIFAIMEHFAFYYVFFKSVFPKVCSAGPMGPATSSQAIRGYISVMATLKFIYF